MKSALLSTASRSIPVTGPTAYADAEEKEEGEEAKRFSALMDMIADACSKMDEGSKRMDARMDSFEERLGKASADSAKKDEDETEEEKKAKADAEDEEKAKADKAKADEDEMADKARKDAEEAEEKAKADAETEKEKEKAEADSVTISRAELDKIRQDITSLHARAPQIISDTDRERFASIQEKAEPVFQAFGDRAPAPLEGETPVQYKRRLGGKMQSHSKHWKDVRLSAIADEAAIDVAVDQIFADATSVGRRGADVPAGNLRAIKTVTEAGHIRIEHIGDPSVMTRMFSGHMQRA